MGLSGGGQDGGVAMMCALGGVGQCCSISGGG